MIFQARTARTPAKRPFPADKTCTFSKKGASSFLDAPFLAY